MKLNVIKMTSVQRKAGWALNVHIPKPDKKTGTCMHGACPDGSLITKS